MKLYFEDRFGYRHIVAESTTKEQLIKEMYKFIHKKNPNFKVYYTRSWIDDEGFEVMDVGSHSEFFLIENEEIDDVEL